MDNLLQHLKFGLSLELQKQGSSLLEFEAELERLEKTAFDPVSSLLGLGTSAIKGVSSLAGAIPEMAITGALMAGTLGGTAAYGAHRHLVDQDKELKTQQDEVDRVRELTHKLKSDYGVH